MARINLLPWREELRNEKKREFTILSGGSAILAVLIVLLAHMQVGGMVDEQMQRNTYLEQATSSLDAKIRKIKELNKVKSQLLARMDVIQALQGSRSLSVHLLDELVTTIPEGLHLSSLKQTGDKLAVTGVAQSNARVSAYMRNIEASEWMQVPVLNVIQSKSRNRHRVAEFSLHAQQESQHNKKRIGGS